MKKLRSSGAFVRLEIIDGIQLVLAGFQSFSVADYTDVVIFIDLFKYGLCILNVLNGRIDDLIKASGDIEYQNQLLQEYGLLDDENELRVKTCLFCCIVRRKRQKFTLIISSQRPAYPEKQCQS
jgi:hypothetical protein